MSTRVHRSRQHYPEFLRSLEAALVRHFSDEWLYINGRAMQVDDILEVIQRLVAQNKRTLAAYSDWLEEARITRDEFRNEISPLLAGLRRFLAEEFGPYNPRLREFGFEPARKPSGDKREEGEGASRESR
jgi:hypothetical protein